jgi:hypothetical protein
VNQRYARLFIGKKGGKKVEQVSICNTKKSIPSMAKAEDIAEWVNVSKDELLHEKCKMIKCYETLPGTPQKLIIMIDTEDPGALNILSRDFGKDWSLETYPVHEIHEVLEENHSIVAG